MIEKILELDSAILLFVQENLRVDMLDKFMAFYTHLADAGELFIAICILMLFIKQTRKAGIIALFAMLLGLIFNNGLLKNMISRERPYLVVEGIIPLIDAPDAHSFPSGHSCASFAFATVCFLLLPRKYGIVALVMAIVMTYSRLYLGVHFPTDIIAGALMGILCGLTAVKLGEKVLGNKL